MAVYAIDGILPITKHGSTGNILSHHHHSQHQGDPRRGQTGGRVNFINHQRQAAGLERTASVQTVVSHSPSQVHHQQQHSVKVSQAVEMQETVKPKVQKETDSIMKSIMKDVALRREGTELRRSKSLYVPHTGGARASVATNIGNSLLNNNSLSNSISLNLSAALFDHQLPQEIAQLITRTQMDLSGYTLAEFAQLARSLVQKADEERKHAERLADACITVIQREPHSTFIEALINYLIYSVEKKMEEPGKSSSHALMAFLSHLYSQVKATGRFMDSKLRSTSNPSSQILHLLAQCCICTLRNPTLTQRNEIECLFFVITTVGRELEQESVNLLGELIDAVRDAFYFAKVSDSRIRKTLLQIMELHASNWQMSAETLSFYQSTANDHLFLK